MQSSDRRVRITEDTSSIILSIENSPLTDDVHRCLTGADYLSLPQPSIRESTYSDSAELGPLASPPSETASSSDSDSLTLRVASLLNKSGEYQDSQVSYSDDKNKTPTKSIVESGGSGGHAATAATGSAGSASNFNRGSFLTSSRVASNSLSNSPSKIGGAERYSFFKAAGGSVDDLVAPPPQFADNTDSAPRYATGNSAVQTLLKSLEWDHAWDVSAPTGFSTNAAGSSSTSNRYFGNTSFAVEHSHDEKTTRPESRSPNPKPSILSKGGDAVSMHTAYGSHANPTSASYTPSTSPDFSSAKYFSEMKHLVEEQMQRREASIGPLLHRDRNFSDIGSTSYSSAVDPAPRRNFLHQTGSTSTASENLEPSLPRYDFERSTLARDTGLDFDNDFRSHRLPPPGPTRSTSSYLRSTGDVGLPSSFHGHSSHLSTDYPSLNRFGESSGRLSASHSDLTTVTPRSGSGLAHHRHHHHHHHHDLHGLPPHPLDDLHSRVVDILVGGNPYCDHASTSTSCSSSTSHSGEATTTVESTHPGSNDAIPPSFPPTIYGNRPPRPVSATDSRSSRLDASVQTSANRLPAVGSISRSRDTDFTHSSSVSVQTSATRLAPMSSSIRTTTETPMSRSDLHGVKLPSTDGTIDLSTIAGLLEEPIRAAVKKCLESELRAANILPPENRPHSRTSTSGHRSPVGGAVSSSVHFVPTEHRSSPTETLTSATGHIGRMLETERRLAELARQRADEQAKRVKRLEEVLGEQVTGASGNSQAPRSPTGRNDENLSRPHSGVGRRSTSPGSPKHSRSPSPTRSPLGRKKVESPVAWFVPANDPGVPKQKSRKSNEGSQMQGVRMDFAAPTRREHNFLTGRIQGMLDPVEPTKSRDEMTLQDALRLSNRSFIVRSTERLRRMRLHAIERKLTTERKKASAAIDLERDDFLDKQAERVNEEIKQRGKSAPAGIPRGRPEPLKQRNKDFLWERPKTSDEMLFAELLACDTASVASTTAEMKRIRADTYRRAKMLPEAVKRMELERRELQAKQNRLRSEIFKQKVLNKLLKRNKWVLPRFLCSDSVLDRVLMH